MILKKCMSFAIMFMMIFSGLPLYNQDSGVANQDLGQPSPSPTSGGTGGLADPPWPMFQRTPDHKGYIASDGPTLFPILWKKNLKDIYTSPVIADGRVYISGYLNSMHTFYCLGAEDGNILWDFIVPSGVVTTTPTVANGKVFVGTFWGVGMFYCLDAYTGNVIWEQDLEPMYTQGAIVIEDVVYVPTNSGTYALNEVDGSKIWFAPGGHIHSGAAVDGDKIFVDLYGLTALNRFDGSQLWTYSCGTLHTTPTVAYGKVFVQTWDGYFYAVDKETGSLAWKCDLNTTHWNVVQSSCAAGNDKIYVGAQISGAANNSIGKFFCFNPDDGTLIWSLETNGSVISSPAISGNGIVYVGAGL